MDSDSTSAHPKPSMGEGGSVFARVFRDLLRIGVIVEGGEGFIDGLYLSIYRKIKTNFGES